MVLHYFIKKENNDKDISNEIYLSMINHIENIVNNKNFIIKKDFNSIFELMTLLLFVVFFAYKKGKTNRNINQKLLDLYIIDLDQTLREQGIGDMSIGKYVKAYVKKIYYRISKLEIIFKKNNLNEFKKYIIKININSNNSDKLSNFLFKNIKNLLNKAKSKELAQFVFEFTDN